MGSISLQDPVPPFINYRPRIAKINKSIEIITITLNNEGKANNIALTTVLMPSCFETILSGLNALKALKPLVNDRSILRKELKTQVIILNKTIMKSKQFH